MNNFGGGGGGGGRGETRNTRYHHVILEAGELFMVLSWIKSNGTIVTSPTRIE